MNKTLKDEFSQSEKIPEELKKTVLNLDTDSILIEIAKRHELNQQVQDVFVENCNNYLYSFNSYSHGFIRNLAAHASIDNMKASVLAKEFKEGVLIPVIQSLKDFNINIDKEVENVFYSSSTLNIKVTDKFIHYSDYPSISPPQPIEKVSKIALHKNFWRTVSTVTFEVFIPEKGRWGTVDSPGVSFRSEDEALALLSALEKAVVWGKFRLMCENIESFH